MKTNKEVIILHNKLSVLWRILNAPVKVGVWEERTYGGGVQDHHL